jgi:hypothetical protein
VSRFVLNILYIYLPSHAVLYIIITNYVHYHHVVSNFNIKGQCQAAVEPPVSGKVRKLTVSASKNFGYQEFITGTGKNI